MKDFDTWNTEKKEVNSSRNIPIAHAREIWWCALGCNVGAETDGKQDNFERPVIAIRVYNKETLLVLPITSKVKKDVFHSKITTNKRIVWVKLTQARVISTKRLIRKVDVLSKEGFDQLYAKWKEFI